MGTDQVKNQNLRLKEVESKNSISGGEENLEGICFEQRKFFRDNIYLIQTEYDQDDKFAQIRIFKNGKLTSSKKVRFSKEEMKKGLRKRVETFHRIECSLFDSVFKLYKKLENLKDGVAHHNLGEVFLGMDLLDEAREQFHKAISKSPDLSLAYNSLGLTCLKLGEKDQALKSFEKALKSNPLYADYLNNYGCAFLEKKMYDKAIQQFEKALELNPRYQDVYLNLGFCYLIRSTGKGEIFSDQNQILALNYFKKAYKVSLRKDQRIGRAIQKAITWEDLSRLYMLLKSNLEEEETFTIKSMCDYFNLRFKYDQDALDEKELGDYLILLNRKITEGRNYPDLRAGLSTAYLFYSRFFIRLAQERFLEEKEETKSVPNLQIIGKLEENLDDLLSAINP
ncbi:MAG: tetratricopeptide repeat protein [Candidatus Zixiibacteriota bacterium]